MSRADIQAGLPGRVTIDEDVAWQKVDGRVVMLVLSSERYYRLDDVATRMWELLDECEDVAAAHSRLHAEYEVDEATLARDLSEFIAGLVDAGILRVAPSAA